jgi:hypothetical protein
MSEVWKRNLPVPFFSQRENNYIWQQINATGQNIGLPVSLAWQSCNITSLCMMLHYFGITNDSPYEMSRKFFEETFPQYRQQAYINWLGDGAILKEFVEKAYNIPEDYITHVRKSMVLTEVETKIKHGYPVWFSFGPLQIKSDRDAGKTGEGHIAVIRGFTKQGDLILNDPWGDPANASGGLKSTGEIRGVYDFSSGYGDNVIMKRTSFNEIIYTAGIHQTLVIEYPHIWSFPVRENSDSTKPLLFSTYGNYGKTEGAKQTYRNAQIAKMRSVEAYDNACYPITGSGRWHDGIHIDKVSGTPVYAIGPGQLVAVKVKEAEERPDGTSTCFALVKHPFPINNNKGTEFYSYFMNLAPTNLAERLENCFNFKEFETDDWFDQIIQHIMPRRIIIRPANEGGLSGVVPTNIPKVYSAPNDNAITTKNLITREQIYLCPFDDNLRKKLFIIDDETSLPGIFTDLNTLGNYKTGGFYCIFDGSESSSGSRQYSKKYIKISDFNPDFLPQNMNQNEFLYYRKKLAALMRGEVVVFNDDDIESNANLIDYHLEVNNQTVVGKTNAVDNLHFGIFSDDCLIDNEDMGGESYNGDNTKFFLVEDMDKSKYFDQYHIVEIMENAKYLIDVDFPFRPFKGVINSLIDHVITGASLKHVYDIKYDMFQTAVARHFNSYTKLGESEWIQMMEDGGAGIFEKNEANRGDRFVHWLSQKWLINEVIDALVPSEQIYLNNADGIFSTFYHPIGFLRWLDNKMGLVSTN